TEQQRAGRDLVLNPRQSMAVNNHAATCQACIPRVKQARDYSRWALGPAMANLAEDEEERRRAIIALFGRTGDGRIGSTSPAAATAAVPALPSSLAAQPGVISHGPVSPAGVIERLRVAAASRVLRIPGMDAVAQLVQQDQDILRRIIGVAVGIGLI